MPLPVLPFGTPVVAPLFVGAVGGPELLVIALVALLLFSPVVVALLLAVGYVGRRHSSEERIAELESEVARLRGRLEAESGPYEGSVADDDAPLDSTAGDTSADDSTAGDSTGAEADGEGRE